MSHTHQCITLAYVIDFFKTKVCFEVQFLISSVITEDYKLRLANQHVVFYYDTVRSLVMHAITDLGNVQNSMSVFNILNNEH